MLRLDSFSWLTKLYISKEIAHHLNLKHLFICDINYRFTYNYLQMLFTCVIVLYTIIFFILLTLIFIYTVFLCHLSRRTNVSAGFKRTTEEVKTL